MMIHTDDSMLDDYPTDTTTEQPERRLSLPSLDSFKAVRDLVALAIDPKLVKRHLRQLHDSLAAVDTAQRQLESDRAAIAAERAEIAAERAEVADAQKKLREREVKLHIEKTAFDERLKLLPPSREPYHADDDGWTAPAGSGMSRTFAPPRSAVPSEPPPEQRQTVHVGREGTTLSQTIEAPPAVARVRPGRKGGAPVAP
jgi:hypothetical protein